MPLYNYHAFTRQGGSVSGTLDAGSTAEVRERLTRQGLFPADIVRTDELRERSWFGWARTLLTPRITKLDVIFFTKQLSVLLKAGIPLLQALELLIEQTEKNLRTILITLRDGIAEGKSLATGLAKYPATFDTTYVQLVRAGEATGKLETILERLVTYLERSEELRKKISGALMLPLIQLTIVFIVVTGILWKVVPDMAPLFNSPDVPLPLPTKILLGLSEFLTSHITGIFVTLVTIIGLLLWWKSTSHGRRTWDSIALKIPLFGYFVRMGAVVQFTRTLGMLMESDVNLAESLSIVTQLITNRTLVHALQVAREKIIQQGRITIYLKETLLFPPVALYLLKTGEESGHLGQMLTTVANTYEEELRDTADQLAANLNPIMIIVMGLLVGFVVIAIGKPILSMGDMVQRGINSPPSGRL